MWRCVNAEYDVASTLRSDVVSTLKLDVVSTLKSDVVSTLKFDVVSTLKSDVVSTLKSDFEKTYKMGCFSDVEINNIASTLKVSCSTSQPKINLKTTLKQHCVPAGLWLSIEFVLRWSRVLPYSTLLLSSLKFHCSIWTESRVGETEFILVMIEFPDVIGGSRGRVAGVATPPPPFGRKILPKKVNFGQFKGFNPPFRTE